MRDIVHGTYHMSRAAYHYSSNLSNKKTKDFNEIANDLIEIKVLNLKIWDKNEEAKKFWEN